MVFDDKTAVRPTDVLNALMVRGMREASGRNDGLEEYVEGDWRILFEDDLPWCATVQLYAHAVCDPPMPLHRRAGELWRMRSVYQMHLVMQERGWWLPPYATLDEGDLIFFNWRLDSDVSRGTRSWHVGVIECVSPRSLVTLEGNVNNALERRTRSRDLASIVGYARPGGIRH